MSILVSFRELGDLREADPIGVRRLRRELPRDVVHVCALGS